MRLRRIVVPEAEDEIREAIDWYEGKREGLGIEFLGTIEAAMQRIQAAPLQGPVWWLDTRYRRLVLHRFPYLLFYDVRSDSIEFVAVAHARRKPGYWLGRV